MISLRKFVNCGGRQLLVSYQVSSQQKVCLIPHTPHRTHSDSRLLLNSVVPNISGQNVNTFFLLQCSNFAIMSTKLCFYVGEVLDIYKQAAGSRYGSVDEAISASSVSYLGLRVYLPLQMQLVSNAPSSLPYHRPLLLTGPTDRPGKILMMRCHPMKARHLCFQAGIAIMTCTPHAPINQLMYHLGPRALIGDNHTHLTLTPVHGATWLEFTQRFAKEALKKMKMKISRW